MPPHCDSLDGPVVRAARRALETRDPQWVLPFAPASAEAEIRRAFDQTLQARTRGPEAARVADTWFFETVVRLHRAGEGAGFEGLKPAGLDVGPIVPLAEEAIETGNLKPLFRALSEGMHEALHRRFDAAMRLKEHNPSDIAAARAYVSAMLGFIVWSHHVHESFGKEVHGEGEAPIVAHAHAH